ncbi:hypothetical protein [Aquamicrobium soli]|uniref:Uncharacterized protein n=1 Tax=Aquamicrobium soli TaxID=1811518 RepID=A0ABV7KFR8_9HYPH
MAHEIHLETNVNQVVNKDVTITVKTGTKAKLNKLGSLLISKGNIEWIPAKNSANKYRMSWADLGKLIAENGKQVKINGG